MDNGHQSFEVQINAVSKVFEVLQLIAAEEKVLI